MIKICKSYFSRRNQLIHSHIQSFFLLVVQKSLREIIIFKITTYFYPYCFACGQQRARLGSISSMFYEQLLFPQIPKAQKDSQVVNLLCAFGICFHKSCSQNVDEIDTRVGAIGHLQPPARALHSELFSELLSLVSSWNEFSRVETRRVEHHFFVTFEKFR